MNWVRQLFTRGRLYRDLSDEMRQHLDEKVDTLVQGGLSRDEAVAAARREFGNVRAIEERGREVWQWPTLESLVFDIRYAFRQLLRHPSFSLVAILILGLGIGANTAVFSIIDTLLFEALAFRDPDRLVWVMRADDRGRVSRSWSVADYEALRDLPALDELTTYEAAFARSSYKLTGDAEPDRVAGVMVPANFFPFLGISPLLGRTFTEEECRLNGPGAVILSHGLWQRRYSARADVIGRHVIVNDRPATIVGVMSPSFDFGAVFAPGTRIDVYMPAVFDVLRDWGNTMAVVARHRPDLTADATQSAINAILERQESERAGAAAERRYHVVFNPFRETIVTAMRRPMLTLWAAVALVLLIVCINLANLLLARGATRRREMALRSAIGAGRGRLVRQLLVESLMLSIAGGGLGVATAYAAIAYLRRLEGVSIPLLRNVDINGAALGLAATISVFTAVLFGLAPALAAVRGDVGETLKAGDRRSGSGREQHRLHSALVVSEVALACLLLVCTGLLLRSFWRVLDIDLGFQPDQVYTLRIDAGPAVDSPDSFRAYMRQLMSAARDVPGIDAASITDAVPLESRRAWGVRAQGQPPDQNVFALIKIIGPGLMAAMQTPVVAGREFTESDDGGGAPVALINRSLAERLWPGQNPVLRTLMVNGNPVQVVGVVGDVRHVNVEQAAGPEFYLSILQRSTMSPSLVVRTGRPFAAVAPSLRRALAEVVPDLPTAGFQPVRRVVDRAMSARRFFVDLLVGFAAVALLLAAIGIYGVVSYSVARRTSEIGVRMALGATSGRIRASVVGDTLRLALTGAVVGIVAAFLVSSVLSSLLFGVSPADPWTYTVAATVLLMVAIAAGLIPAVRASRISPMTALRID